jgi:hypothetical protein
MTLAAEILGWFFVGGGFFMTLAMEPRGLGVGAAGAVLLAMAYTGVFNL